MDLPPPLAWLVDDAAASPSPARFLAELGRHMLAADLPLVGGAITLPTPHPIVASRTWLWRAPGERVIEALAFAASPPGQSGRAWLESLGAVHEDRVGAASDILIGWAAPQPIDRDTAGRLREIARFAAAPLTALAMRQSLAALLDAYLGRRSAARIQAGSLRRKAGETIRAALLYADLRDFTAISEVNEPAVVIAALDAWFERVAGGIHAFGGEVLKFMGDGVLAIFPVSGNEGEACNMALQAVAATRAGMARLNEERQLKGLVPLSFGAALHLGEIFWGNIGAADRLDFTAIGLAVNLVSRLEGLCRPLGQSVLVSEAFASATASPFTRLGAYTLRGIASPCTVFTLSEV